ncbi:helix-turn-helix transcriptional regulator [Methylobacterium oryzae CBMB20]
MWETRDMSGVRPDLFARLHDDLEAGFREDLEEAVVDPARWQDLAERAVRASGSEGALLLRSDRTGLESLCTASLADASRRYFDEGWHRDDHRMRGIPLMRTRGIAVDQDFTTPDEIARLPFYQDLLASRGLRWFAGIGFAVKGRLWCLSLQRTVEQGPYEPHEQRRLATLSPLLQRAALLTSMVERARLAGLTGLRADRPRRPDPRRGGARAPLERRVRRPAGTRPEARGRSPHRGGSGSRAAAGSPRAALRSPADLRRRGGATGRAADRHPRRAAGRAEPRAVRRRDHAAPRKCSRHPTRTRDRDSPGGLSADPGGGATRPGAVERDLLAEAASRFAITAATARSQLKAIFAKTGATRQSDLVRLVAGLAR